MGQPRHQINHRNHDYQDQRHDIREFFIISSGYPCRRDASRDTTNGDSAGEYHGGTAVYSQATGYVVGKEPYDGNNQYGLYQPDCSRFHDITEQYSGSQAYDSDFNKKFALYGGTHPGRDMEYIPDYQSENNGEKDGFKSVISHLRDGCRKLGQ